MEDSGPLYLSLALIVFLIFLNAVFVAAEFAFARLRKSQVEEIIESKSESKRRQNTARKLKEALEHMNDYISSCQVGITIASLALGAIAEAQIEVLISPWIEHFNLNLDVHMVSILLAVTIITYFHVVLGEVVPKSWALAKPESTGMALIGFIDWFHKFFTLPVWILNGSSNVCLRMCGVDPVLGEVAHSEEELKRILSTSQEEGILEEEEEEMMQNIFEFNDTVAKEIMTPRTDMVCLDEDITIDEAIKTINKEGYTRYPLFKDRLDNITGYVTIKDIFIAYSDGMLGAKLKSISNIPIRVPDGTFIIDLMREMQSQKKQLAILIDEFGGTSGLATTEDIVEEIFGEIQDENEAEQDPIRQVKEDEFIFDGLVSLEDTNEATGSNFESDHYETIGGYVFSLVGSNPKRGDRVESQGFILVVEKHDKQRVREVRIIKVSES